MVILGAGASFLGLSADALAAGIEAVFAAKGEDVVETNLRGFRLGLEAGEREADS